MSSYNNNYNNNKACLYSTYQNQRLQSDLQGQNEKHSWYIVISHIGQPAYTYKYKDAVKLTQIE